MYELLLAVPSDASNRSPRALNVSVVVRSATGESIRNHHLNGNTSGVRCRPHNNQGQFYFARADPLPPPFFLNSPGTSVHHTDQTPASTSATSTYQVSGGGDTHALLPSPSTPTPPPAHNPPAPTPLHPAGQPWLSPVRDRRNCSRYSRHLHRSPGLVRGGGRCPDRLRGPATRRLL